MSGHLLVVHPIVYLGFYIYIPGGWPWSTGQDTQQFSAVDDALHVLLEALEGDWMMDLYLSDEKNPGITFRYSL